MPSNWRVPGRTRWYGTIETEDPNEYYTEEVREKIDVTYLKCPECENEIDHLGVSMRVYGYENGWCDEHGDIQESYDFEHSDSEVIEYRCPECDYESDSLREFQEEREETIIRKIKKKKEYKPLVFVKEGLDAESGHEDCVTDSTV